MLSSLDTLAKGEPLCSSLANELFNTLIYCEAYSVFVDAFAKLNDALQTSEPYPLRAPFVSTLTLELPADWEPQCTVALQQAFQQIRVERVVVQAVDGTAPMPEEINGCLAELIKGGATQLCIRGT